MTTLRTQCLTEAQRACLRLVLAGMEAKEIALELGISHHAVVERLRAARRVLGVGSSREAARLLASDEELDTYMWHVAKPNGVAATSGLDEPMGRPDHGERLPADLLVEDRQVRFEPDYLRQSTLRTHLPFPTAEKPWNDLSSSQRIMWVVAIAFGVALMLGGLTTGSVSVIEALAKLF